MLMIENLRGFEFKGLRRIFFPNNFLRQTIVTYAIGPNVPN
jgi:hypothetical protein